MNRTTLLIGICFGGGGGLSSTILTQLNQLMCSRNYTTGEIFVQNVSPKHYFKMFNEILHYKHAGA
jgi:hypothetical protein